MSDPVIISPTCQILCAAEVPGIDCNTSYFHEDTDAIFTVPASSGSAVVSVCNSAQYAIGAYVWIDGAGFFEVIARPNANAISVQNNGTTGNSTAGTAVAAGAAIVHMPPPETSRWLEGSDTWDPGSIADGDEEAKEVTVTGAALGDFVLVSFSLDVADLAIVGSVTAADTVTVLLLNNTGGAIDLAEGTVRVRVLPM